MHRLLILVFAAFAAAPAAEPTPRALAGAAVAITPPLAHVTAVRELSNGKLLISDVSTPRVVIVDRNGAASPVGAAGAGPTQYVQPSGFYSGAKGEILLSDHSGPRAIVLSADGKITGSYATNVRGVRSSSDGDVDHTQLDSRGFAYSSRRDFRGGLNGAAGTIGTPVNDLIRLDPVKQTQEVVTKLLQPREEVLPAANNMSMSRSVIGDPTDGWTVLSDGRVAVVRAAPYRLEWISPDGKSTKGPIIDYTPLPMTPEDKQAALAKNTGSAGAGMVGGGMNTADMPRKFADTRPPFSAMDIIASPAGRVWVMRTQPLNAASVLYDVFDTAGLRVDRVQFPKDSRVVGFGAGAVFVREGSGTSEVLKKYKLS